MGNLLTFRVLVHRTSRMLFVMAFLLLAFSCSSSVFAQQYSGVVLSDFAQDLSLAGRYYVIDDTDTPLTLNKVETIVRSGELGRYKSTSDVINMGVKGKSLWIVLPVSSISSFSNWKMSFGTQLSGRYAPLRSFMLYNMNNRSFLYTTDVANSPSNTVPETFPLPASAKTSTFFILYLRSSPGVMTVLKPVIINPRMESPLSVWAQWLVTAITFAGFLSLLAIYRAVRNLSYVFMAGIWFLAFVRHLFVTNFLYISLLESDFLIPLSWSLSSFLLLAALWTSPGSRNDIPPSLIIGAACLFMISSITGLILMHPLPVISPFLLYGPVALCALLVALSTWPFIIVGRRKESLCLASVSLFILALICSIFLLNYSLIPHSTITLALPEIFLCCAIIFSILCSSPRRESFASHRNLVMKDDSFDDDLLELGESPLKDAKELSEHKRLIQVLEKERHNMSIMQVQAARQTEDMRKSKEEADEANRAKSAFLAIVSHEIRTPMTGIMGMVRLLQDTQLTKEQREYATTIKDSGDAMLSLLNDILDYEKIESGKMDLEIINCDIKRLARTIHTLMGGHASSKNVDLALELDPALPHLIKCDPTRLRQVLLNLLNNAIKFTSKGTVYLRVRDLTSDEMKAKGISQLYFAVQDSGIGISAEAQKKLFMPFSQADSSISRKYGGTGLGLAICKRLIETMGGEISISSKEGEGSTFFFTLNFGVGEGEEEGEVSASHLSPSTSDLSKVSFTKELSILVVDDNGINQRVVAGFAEKLGAQCLTASEGHEALSQITQNHFDLILMDIELPGMSGLEVTHSIRHLTLRNKATIPVVALSGNISDDDIESYRLAGMNDFAPKPITMEKMTELLLKADDQAKFIWGRPVFTSPADQDSESRPSGVAAADANIEAATATDDAEIDLTISQEALVDFDTVSEIGGHANSSSTPADDIDLDTSFLDIDNIDLDEDDDSFAEAVRRFEEMESTPPSSSSSPGSANPAQDPAPDVPLDPPLNPNDLSAFGLDETMLTSLKSGLPAEVLQDILIGFYEKADELVAAIGMAYLDQNAPELKARAHELKGMAGNFGFSRVSSMCATIESAAKSGDLSAAKDATELLGERYAVSRNRLSQWIAQSIDGKQ